MEVEELVRGLYDYLSSFPTKEARWLCTYLSPFGIFTIDYCVGILCHGHQKDHGSL